MNVAYDPPSWQNFYLMTGGAALTGLLFVAMSLHANRTTPAHYFASLFNGSSRLRR
jgi:hypothetical protein